MNLFIAGWYVVYTKPRHERKVAEILGAEEVEFYLPTRKTLRIWHDRKKYINAPLFESYVFVYLRSLKDHYKALKIEGVLHYVKFGKEIARVSDKIINDIRAIVNYGECIDVNTDYYALGRKLFIQQGPLTGITCEVIEPDNKQNIRVVIQLLQRNLLISLPADHLITEFAG